MSGLSVVSLNGVRTDWLVELLGKLGEWRMCSTLLRKGKENEKVEINRIGYELHIGG